MSKIHLTLCTDDQVLIEKLEQFLPTLITTENQVWEALASGSDGSGYRVLISDIVPNGFPYYWSWDLVIYRIDSREKYASTSALEMGGDLVFDFLDESTPDLIYQILSSLQIPRGRR